MLVDGSIRRVAAVEDVVLRHEDDVKADRKQAQEELDRVARDAGPVV